MPLTLAKCFCVTLLVFAWFAQQEAGTPIRKGEGDGKQQQAESQPTPAPSQTPTVQADGKQPEAGQTGQGGQEKKENASSDAAWSMTLAETLGVLLNFLVFLLLAVQTYTLLQQERGLKGQGELLERQAVAMQGQLAVMRDTLTQNERAVAAAEANVAVAKETATDARAATFQQRYDTRAQLELMGAQTAAIGEQLDVMREQAKLGTRQVDAMILSERAYLGIEKVGFTDLEIGKFPKIVVLIKNAGRTPARKVKAPGKISIERAGNKPARERITSRFIGDGMLAAGAVRNAVYQFTEPCNVHMLYDIQTEAIKVFIQGTIWYEDAWGQEWDTSFFLEWDHAQQAFADCQEKEAGEQEREQPNLDTTA